MLIANIGHQDDVGGGSGWIYMAEISNFHIPTPCLVKKRPTPPSHEVD